ncbi:MAG: epoxyqueuosine reductase QueH [PVC group bacterium]
MRILLHICCGPCATYPFKILSEEGHQVDGYFYNPNIHPYREYLKRKEAVGGYAEKTGVKVIFAPRYDMEEFFRLTAFREAARCRYCYYLRLRQTTAVARKGRYDAFTTTLLISKQQKHELARKIAEDVSRETGIEFLYRDFREGWKEHWDLTERYGLYKQQYCGCLYSEYERFKFPGKNLKQ